MSITDIKVDWMAGCANMPMIEVHLSKAPPGIDEIPHKQKTNSDGSVLYYGQKEGFVSYFCENSNKEGFGGRSFDILMEDGSIKTLVGPWSSRASVMNEEFVAACVEVTFNYDGNPYPSLKYAGAMSVVNIIEALSKLSPEIELFPVEQYGELHWIPKVKSKLGKWELDHGNAHGNPNYMPDELIIEWDKLTPMERQQRRFID